MEVEGWPLQLAVFFGPTAQNANDLRIRSHRVCMLSNPKSFEVIRWRDIIGTMDCLLVQDIYMVAIWICVQRGVLHQVFCCINSLKQILLLRRGRAWAEDE